MCKYPAVNKSIIVISWLLYSSVSVAGGDDFVQNKKELCKKRVLTDMNYISETNVVDYNIKIISATSDNYIKCALYYQNHKDSELFREAATLYDQLSVHLQMDTSSQINAMSIDNIKLELLMKQDDLTKKEKHAK